VKPGDLVVTTHVAATVRPSYCSRGYIEGDETLIGSNIIGLTIAVTKHDEYAFCLFGEKYGWIAWYHLNRIDT
jgi:hypothetical protein